MSSHLQQTKQRSKPSISEYFNGKTVAITGATGFIGQVLVEKLLRSCPGITKIILLIRSKHGRSSDERLKHFVKSSVFERLKITDPNFSSKLAVVTFALELEDFGLSKEGYHLITSEVNIIFHSAATVRFNEHLRRSYNVNTLAVRRLLKICREVKNLEAVVHVSTGYCYCNYDVIEEQVYPTGWDYDKLSDALKWMSDDMVSNLNPEILADRPNTYTLTKALGEEIIVKEGNGLPICIVRPSIVFSSLKEPVPGWCFNLNGVAGMCVVYGKGWMRALCGNHVNSLDVIPVDLVANGMIAAAWKTAYPAAEEGRRVVSRRGSLSPTYCLPANYKLRSLGYVKPIDSEEEMLRRQTIPVYHLVANPGLCLKLVDLRDKGEKILNDYPFDNLARPPYIILSITNNAYEKTQGDHKKRKIEQKLLL